MTPRMDPGISGITDVLPGSDWTGTKPVPSVGTSPTGGGGSAQDGLGQIDTGAGTVRGALSTAASALGGAGGPPPGAMYKKGGYVSKGGKLNLGSGRISTASKNKNCSSW
jgi:hypothetical protein